MIQSRKVQELQAEIKKYQRIRDIWDSPEYNTAIRRLQQLSVHEILNWADEAGTGMVRAFDDYRLRGTPESLEELRRTISILQAAVEDLMYRHGK